MSVLVLGMACKQLASTDKITGEHVLASSICRGRGHDMHVVGTSSSARHKVTVSFTLLALRLPVVCGTTFCIFLLQY